MNKEKFFRKSDWTACWVTFAISLAVYVLTLQPTLGLEDSGELIVASDYLGVPHPPGYPIWTLLTWFFQWVFHSVTFHGHPNPAWAVNLFSAVAGAAACGVLALLISRSGMDLLRSMKKESKMLGEKTESLFCAVAGISGGLLLAFGQGMWSQAVIAEVYTLNILFQSLVLLFLYRWMSDPKQPIWLFLCAFVFGLGITNHQTLMFMGLAMAIGILFRDWKLGRDFIITCIPMALMVVATKVLDEKGSDWSWLAGWDHIGFWVWTAYAIIIPIIAMFTLPKGKIVGPTFLVMLVGLSFYLYMPFSSDQNPPINWGYPRTWQGFMHAITRGQYERVKLAHVLTNPAQFIAQLNAFFIDLRSQYLPLVLTGFIPFAAWKIKRFSAALVAITLFVIAASLLTISTLFAIKSPELVDIASTLNDMANPFIIMLFLLFALGFALTISNFIQISMLQIVALWKKGGAWNTLTILVILGFFIVLIAGGIYIDAKLLGNLIKEGGNQLFRDNLIIFLSVILPPLLIIGSYTLKKSKNIGLRFDISELGQNWFITTFVAFISVGLIFIILQNPKMDIQNMFIGRVQYIQSHAIYVIWMGYGLLLIMTYIETLFKNNPLMRGLLVVGMLVLPFVLIAKNKYDPRQLLVVGGAEQNGHDFGWQFGNWQLQGVDGVKEDMQAWYSPEEFEQQWAAYPNKNYPEPMGPNAIFFGGTDPGRFVPTYMIYSAKVRQDVYLITQNALADNTYMNVMRDLYGDQIWIPSPLDSNRAFQMYIQGVQSGKIKAGADVTTEGGKVQVQGVGGVMKINGFLSKMIFDHNQYLTETKTDEATRPTGSATVYADPSINPETGLPPQRTFYVEESYVLPWMYPYLTPHGLIMKINNKPTPLTAEMIKNDTDFWGWYCERLLSDQKFIRDIVARKSFSKLRSALAGLYAARGKPKEAEAAFRQAINLYDLSPEANLRLADLISRQGRFDEAIELFEVLLTKDPNNEKAREFQKRLEQTKSLSAELQLLEQQLKLGNIEFNDAMRLISIHFRMNQFHQADSLAKQILNSENLQPQMAMELAQFMAQGKRLPVVELALKKYTALNPNNPEGWINLAALQVALNKRGEMFVSIQKSIDCGGEPTRNMIRKDKRFDSIRHTKEYRNLVPPIQNSGRMGLVPLPGI